MARGINNCKNMRYLPHTQSEVDRMLATIGVGSIDELFSSIPEHARLRQPLPIPLGLDEISLMEQMEALAESNIGSRSLCFLGGGIYDHFVPPVVDQLLLRGEFYTAYTPYQAEVAQGTLMAIFEFQTMIAELFGMAVANASMYDGASAAAEAVLMAQRLTKRRNVWISRGVHPEAVATIQTYLAGDNACRVHVSDVAQDGTCNLQAMRDEVDETTACVAIGLPNFYGCVSNAKEAAEIAHAKGALVITVTMDPYALALVEPPGAVGVDIAVGEGQALGLPMQYGGPGCGLFACRGEREYLQQIPGRICGETVDSKGTRGYVLTLATREQHIRRERATSNICTNHSLCALAIAIRLALLGKKGFIDVATLSLSKAEYAKQKLTENGLWKCVYSAPTFNEFVVRSQKNDLTERLANAADASILAGIPLARFEPHRDRDLLIAVTEKHKKSDIDRLVEVLCKSL